MKLAAKIICGLLLGYLIYKTVQLELEIRNCTVQEVVGFVSDKFIVDKGRGSTFELRNTARGEGENRIFYLTVGDESYNVGSKTFGELEIGDKVQLTLLPVSSIILQIDKLT
jgi:hypothetical protein